jgi:hypothetical protein
MVSNHHEFKWQTKLNVKPIQPANGLWRFPIPQAFGLGKFLKQSLKLQLQHHTLALPDSTACRPVNPSVAALCFQSIVVFCDRLMYWNGSNQHPNYANCLRVPHEQVPTDFGTQMMFDDIILDQSAFNNWVPPSVDTLVAADTMLALGKGNSDDQDDERGKSNSGEAVASTTETAPDTTATAPEHGGDNAGAGTKTNNATEAELHTATADANDSQASQDAATIVEQDANSDQGRPDSSIKGDQGSPDSSSKGDDTTSTAGTQQDANSDQGRRDSSKGDDTSNTSTSQNDSHASGGDSSSEDEDTSSNTSTSQHGGEDNQDSDDDSLGLDNIPELNVTAEVINNTPDNIGQLPVITAAWRKRRRETQPVSPTKAIKLTLEQRMVKEEKERALNIQEAIRKMKNHECCSMKKCKLPGGATYLDPADYVDGMVLTCMRCQQLAHRICLQFWPAAKQLHCFLCLDIVKAAAARQPRALPKPKTAGLAIPRELRKPRGPNDKQWKVPHRKWKMNKVLALEMARLNYMPWPEMRAMVVTQNAANARARRYWDQWSAERQAKHKAERNRVQAARLEYVKTYCALEKEFLRTTKSFISDVRYDSTKKCFIGRAEWQHDVGDRTVLNQQEVPLSPEFVQATLPVRVQNYVKRACSMSKNKFFPVPLPVVLNMDTRVATHCKFQAASDTTASDSVWVKYSNKDVENLELEDAVRRFGSKYVDILKTFAQRGFIHIPPGDAKLNKGMAPMHSELSQGISIHFPQGDQCICVFASFASALWALGLEALAMHVAAVMPTTMDDPAVLQALVRVMLSGPHSFLQPIKIQPAVQFQLLEVDLSMAVAVVVLKSSDGSISHAITVHDSLIFDSNESVALPLCQENLNYICSTETRQAHWVGIVAGYLFREQGKQQQLLQSKQNMPGDPWQCQSPRQGNNKH